MTLLAGLLTLLVMPPAQANHGDRTLQVDPEIGGQAVGTAITVTATLSEAATTATGSIPIDAEIWDGPADSDGPTPATPDRTCTVAVGATECSFSVVAGIAGTSDVRVWVDHDNRNEIGQGGVTELDQAEGRLADGTPDFDPQEGSEQPPEADCRQPEDFETADLPPFGNAGDCGADMPPADATPGMVAEPDGTDVVRLTWANAEALDCDASNGSDRITESDAVTGSDASVTITCTYRGTAMDGIRVDGANISGDDGAAVSDPGGANDPQGTGGIDYTCTHATEESCQITVSPVDSQTGPAILCFWLDLDDDGAFAPAAGGDGNGADGQGCADERVDDPENDDRTDRVLVRWGAAPVATTLDVTPESGSGTAGSFRAVLAVVTDQYGDPMFAATPVNFEFVAGSPGDNGDDSTAESPDRACTTSNGRCAIAYEVSRAGVDVICGWVGATPTLTGTSPGGNCSTETTGGDTRANIDVVTWNWTTPPASGSGGGTAESVASTQGYTLVGADGGIFNFGTSQFHGSTGSMTLNQPVIGMANKRGGTGYWLVARDGGIFTFGDAEFFGSTGSMKLNAPVLGMEATPSGKGYFLFAADGGIFTFGDAKFHGSTGDMKLNAPAVGLSINDKGDGYWLVAQDGGIFSFGNVPFHGSTGSMKLNQPVFDMAPTAGDKGYWLVAKDGGIFSFGDAAEKFYGSAVGTASGTVIGMGTTPTFNGYWIADSAGGVYPFGDARALGDRRGQAANAVYVGFATVPRG